MKAKPKFLGVCSYIANKYNLDVFIIRIATIATIITTGIIPGLVVYFMIDFLIEET